METDTVNTSTLRELELIVEAEGLVRLLALLVRDDESDMLALVVVLLLTEAGMGEVVRDEVKPVVVVCEADRVDDIEDVDTKVVGAMEG